MLQNDPLLLRYDELLQVLPIQLFILVGRLSEVIVLFFEFRIAHLSVRLEIRLTGEATFTELAHFDDTCLERWNKLELLFSAIVFEIGLGVILLLVVAFIELLTCFHAIIFQLVVLDLDLDVLVATLASSDFH